MSPVKSNVVKNIFHLEILVLYNFSLFLIILSFLVMFVLNILYILQ